jgi:NAD+ kinase
MVKMKKLKKIAISSNLPKKKIDEIVNQCCEIIENLGLEVMLTEDMRRLSISKTQKSYSDKYIIENADVLISIGGDGTILSCARKFGKENLPILGINLGKVGFLADLSTTDLTHQLKEILDGRYLKDKRFLLRAKIEGDSKTRVALNEIVIHSGAVAQMIEYEVFLDDIFLYRQKADGLIINTPTGSTAYSMSGGGPIMHPSVNAFTLLPMFPHSLSSNPLLVNDDSKIKIRIINCKKKTMLSLDSHDTLPVKVNDVILIDKNPGLITLIHPTHHDFFSSCRDKLGWSIGIDMKTIKDS